MNLSQRSSIAFIKKDIAKYLYSKPEEVELFYKDSRMFDEHQLNLYSKNSNWVTIYAKERK